MDVDKNNNGAPIDETQLNWAYFYFCLTWYTWGILRIEDLSYGKGNLCYIFATKTCYAEVNIVDHLLAELTRITRFFMDPGARMTPTLRSSYYHQWPLLQGGFEIPFSLEVHRSSITSSKKFLERYTKVVEALHIKNPSWWQQHWFFDSNTRDNWFSDSCYFGRIRMNLKRLQNSKENLTAVKSPPYSRKAIKID